MRNIDITEWMMTRKIDPYTEIIRDGKKVFLADVLEHHLIEQLYVYESFKKQEIINKKNKK